MWGTPIYMISNPDYMKIILDNSPFIFGPGLHKSRYFHSFMKDNVGVSKACPWKYRRALNEHVLDSGQSHQLLPLYYKDIDKIMTRYPYPRNHEEFTVLGKKLAGLVIFNDPNPSPDNTVTTIYEAVSSIYLSTVV
jgi:hypothetical protein